MSIRLAVLYGGRSGEHEVSRRSAASILAHLAPDTYRVTEVLIDRDGRWQVDGEPVALGTALRVLRPDGAPAWTGDPHEPIVNEVNTFPGFTAASQYPRIWQRAGLGFSALLDILIAGALPVT